MIGIGENLQLSFTIRQKLPFEAAPLHGLILLTGAPERERRRSLAALRIRLPGSFRARNACLLKSIRTHSLGRRGSSR